MHMGSYKSLTFFQVCDTGWFHTFIEFGNHSDIGWDNVWSRRCFPPCSFRSHAAEFMVARLRDNFWVSHFGCKIKTFIEFGNHSDIGWDNVWSRRCFPPCSFRSHAAEFMVARLRDNLWVSHFGCKIKTVPTAKMPRRCSFQDRWLNDSGYQEWVLKDKLDKHYTWCMACEIQLIFVCSLLLRWSLQNIILVLTSPYKVFIWL